LDTGMTYTLSIPTNPDSRYVLAQESGRGPNVVPAPVVAMLQREESQREIGYEEWLDVRAWLNARKVHDLDWHGVGINPKC
jgi:hypothetical protein